MSVLSKLLKTTFTLAAAIHCHQQWKRKQTKIVGSTMMRECRKFRATTTCSLRTLQVKIKQKVTTRPEISGSDQLWRIIFIFSVTEIPETNRFSLTIFIAKRNREIYACFRDHRETIASGGEFSFCAGRSEDVRGGWIKAMILTCARFTLAISPSRMKKSHCRQFVLSSATHSLLPRPSPSLPPSRSLSPYFSACTRALARFCTSSTHLGGYRIMSSHELVIARQDGSAL